MEAQLDISPTLAIPLRELYYRTSRSSGPGGQHVNTSDTRVELLFCVASSQALSSAQRTRLLSALGGRIDSRGVLHISCQVHRSQIANRREVTWRFRELLRGALRKNKPRLATRPTRASQKRRLEAKNRRAQAKRMRRPPENER